MPSGILLALDTDGPGQKATEENGSLLADLFRWWGIPRYEGEPDSIVIAHLQLALDDLAEKIQAYESVDLIIDQTIAERIVLWDYMWGLWRSEKTTVFSRATSPEELEAALAVEDNPILPNHGRIDYEAIKNNVDITDYISRDVVLKPNGATLKGKCPFHEEKTASFYVYPATRSFYCYGCRVGGDVIEYAKLKGVRLG